MIRTRKTIRSLIVVFVIAGCVIGSFVPMTPMPMTVPVQADQKYTLEEYRSNAIKSFGKTYDRLFESNEYSAFGRQQLKLIKEIGENAINAAKSKTKIKQAKTAAIEDFNSIITLPDETRITVIAFLKDDKSIKKSKRAKAIKKLEGMTDIKDMLSLGAKYGYEPTDRVTIGQMEDRIKLLGKKYPKYSEDEIRSLVATANLDYIDDSELFSVYKVNNIDALEQKINKADELIKYAGEITGIEYRTRYYNKNFYDISNYIRYDSIFWVNDLIIRDDIRVHADYLCKLLKSMVEEDYTEKQCKKDESGSYDTNGFLSMLKLQKWFYDYPQDSFAMEYRYDTSLVINVNDDRLKGSEGYVLDKFIYSGAGLMIDGRGKDLYVRDDSNKAKYKRFGLDMAYNENNYLVEIIEKIEKSSGLER